MDRALVEKHLAHIVEMVERLRRHARPGELATDPVQFVRGIRDRLGAPGS